MHNGFLQVEGEKMSKSLGNFVTINELLATDTFGGRTWPGEVLRLAMLKTHYRQPIDWTVKALEEAEKTLGDWAAAAAETEVGQVPAAVIEALADDLNTSQVLAELHALRKAGDYASLKASLALLGIGLPQIAVAEIDDVLRAKVEASIAARLAARKAKNFAESDRLRDDLVAMGIVLMDGKDPATGELITSWEMKR
jgi:cysteinyl-tRNA synthetase